MAATHKKFLCLFLFFGVVGLGLHLVGFVFPGWIVMKRSVMDIRLLGISETEITENIRITEGQLIDEGGLPGPDKPPAEAMMRRGGKSDGKDEMMKERQEEMMKQRQDGMMKNKDMEIMEFAEEDITFHKFILSVMGEVSFEELSFHYGLWYTKICAHKTMPKGHEMDDDDMVMPEAEERMVDDDSSSSSSSEEHHGGKHHKGRKHHGKKCHCIKLSTKCALKNAKLAESPASMEKNMMSPSNMGHGSLKEHQVETSIGLALMVIGLVFGVVTFRKPDGCRCVKIATVLIMLTAVVLVAVPVMRMAHYTHFRRTLHDGVYVKCPYSAILSGAGCVMALLSGLIALCGLIAQKRTERSGQWYRFNNDMAEEKKSEKGPALVFYNDPYPVKAGLTDVCDFSDIKPVETVTEPEKKPLE